jgi:hypothetical protein
MTRARMWVRVSNATGAGIRPAAIQRSDEAPRPTNGGDDVIVREDEVGSPTGPHIAHTGPNDLPSELILSIAEKLRG